MKNELVTKEVDFCGDTIMCAQDNSNGKIYVGVSWICNGIGFTKSQKDTQVQKIQTDFVLKMGCLKFQAGVFDDNNETFALELECLPLWLAKVAITPKMIDENIEFAKKLANYQLRAKDVLAKAFIKPKEIDIDNFHIPTTLSEALLLSANLAKENEVMKPKAEQFDLYLKDDGTLSLNQTAKALKTKRNKMMEFLRAMKVFNQDNSPASYYSNKEYFEVKNFTYVVQDGKKYQIAITRVTSKGQDFLYRYLTKHIDEYIQYDKDFKNKISEVKS